GGGGRVELRFWGTRGSLAKPGPDTVRYGGNTSCVEVVSSRGTRLVIDCGTGGHELGQAIMREGGPSRGHMLISHTHWDHIQGIPFFTPFFVPGHAWDLYAPQGFGESLRETLAGQMEYTYFPVTPEAFGAKVRYNNLGEGRFAIEDFTIHTRYLNHPALALAFRIEADGACLVYSCDHEPHDADAACGAVPLEDEDLAHAAFMDSADLIIHDAQYLAHEYAAKRGWGHSTLDYAVAVARAARVPKLVLTHHDPIRTDDAIDAAVAELRAAAPGVDVIAAAEGMVIALGATGETGTTPSRPAPADAPDAIRHGPAAATPRVLLIAADEDVAARIARALRDEPIDLVRVRDAEDARAAMALRPGLVLVECGLTAAGRVVAMLAAQGDDATPVVLLGGSGPSGDAAVDRLDEPWSCEYARTRIRTWLMRAECHWSRAAIPADEAERLAALRALRLLDTPTEERFDRLTRMAAALFRVPVALVSLVDAERQWFKSRVGADVCETSRESSFCAHAVVARETMVVPDALADPRFRDNPLVTGAPHIRFYAGAPIHAPGGQPVGTLCILDTRPRALTDADRALLEDCAATVEGELARSV
ncbi:MAG: GAF domain-containing protein, partial [Sphingomonas sp.]